MEEEKMEEEKSVVEEEGYDVKRVRYGLSREESDPLLDVREQFIVILHTMAEERWKVGLFIKMVASAFEQMEAVRVYYDKSGKVIGEQPDWGARDSARKELEQITRVLQKETTNIIMTDNRQITIGHGRSREEIAKELIARLLTEGK